MIDSLKSMAKQWRVLLVLFGLFLCVLIIAWKLSALHVLEKDFLQVEGDKRTIRNIPLVAHRGLITDRNGEPLAVSTPVQSIWVDPSELVHASEVIGALANALDLNPDVLTNSIANHASSKFLYVKRRLAPADAKKVLDLNLNHVGA